MKKNMSSIIIAGSIFTLAIASATTPASAQVSRGAILKSNLRNAQARAEAVRQVGEAERFSKKAALAKASALKWHTKGTTPDGQEFELVGLNADGSPRYNVTTLMQSAAMSVNSIAVHNEPYNLKGNGVVIGIWDSGLVRTSHVEFNNTGAPRSINIDAGAFASHSTGVAGAAIAAGTRYDAEGAASAATTNNYDWNMDVSEILSVASASSDDGEDRIQVSNHSYASFHGWGRLGGYYAWYGANYDPATGTNREDASFGRYCADTAALDAVAYQAPYYLHVRAAGNDRADGYAGPAGGTFIYIGKDGLWTEVPYNPETAPLNDYHQGGYDTIPARPTAKNVLTVGAITAAVVNNVFDPSKAQMSTFSGWGPTDDGRIKPDVVAQGQSVRLVSSTGDTAYGSGSGTSFAAPGAAGVTALLIERARAAMPQWHLRASTLKGLLIHGAADLGNAGPDYTYGWGVVDAVKSIETLNGQLNKSTMSAGHIVEDFIQYQTETETFHITWDGSKDLVTTLVWTDVPGTEQPLSNDNPDLRLVNDLDLRVQGPDGVYLPWVLDPANPSAPATTGDNFRDNVEQVRIATGATSGTYTITINIKSSTAEAQWYSLITTGQLAVSEEPIAIDSVTPSTAPADTEVTVEVKGRKFYPGTKVTLKKGETKKNPSNLQAASDTIIGELSLSGLEAGSWDLVVERPDGEATVIPNALSVQQDTSVSDWQSFGGLD